MRTNSNGEAPRTVRVQTRLGSYAGSSAQEPHYSIREIAGMWNLSSDKIRRMFEYEEGVLRISNVERQGKRSYSTLRIPESVLKRVHSKLRVVR